MVKTIALLFGIIYTLVGILGFVTAAGGTFSMSPSNLLGYFPINAAHNVVHLVIGIPGLFASRSESAAAGYLKLFGVILIIVGLLGFFWPNPFNVLPIGGIDIALHLVTGVIFVLVGFAARSTASATA